MSQSPDTGSVLFVRDHSQLATALTAGVRAEHVACSTRAAFLDCRKRGLNALQLSEDPLSPDAATMNGLALERTFELIERFPAGSDDRTLLDANFMTVQSVFMHILKCARVLRELGRRWKVNSLSFVEEPRALSVLVYRRYAARFEPDWKLRALPVPAKPAPAPSAVSRSKRVLFGISDALGRRLIRRARKRGRSIGVLSGGLNHLAPVIAQMRAERRLLVFAENKFNLQKFIYCLRHGLCYVRLAEGPASSLVPEPAGGFVPEGRMADGDNELSGLANDVLRAVLGAGWLRFTIDPAAVRELFELCRPDFVLLDEDLALRRLIAIEAGRAGIRCIVVSHGVPGFALDPKLRNAYAGRYQSAPTLVQSEFEAKMYDHICYDGSKMIRSGVPRYDRLVTLRSAADKQGAQAKESKTILYCGAIMQDYDFDEWLPWLGLSNVFGELTERYALDLIRSVGRRSDVTIELKPHFNDEALWRKSLSGIQGDKARVRLLSHRANTFELIARADLVVTIESSVVTEAVMLDKPVIMLNYTPFELFADYHSTGVADCARDPQEFEQALARCLDEPGHLSAMAENRRKAFTYYAGRFDGRNAERAARLAAGEAYVQV